jgi:hypothetical protein
LLSCPQKECGLHSGNISSASGDEERSEAADLWPSGAVAALDKPALSSLLDGPREKDTLVALYAPWCQFCKVRFKEPVVHIRRCWQLRGLDCRWLCKAAVAARPRSLSPPPFGA